MKESTKVKIMNRTAKTLQKIGIKQYLYNYAINRAQNKALDNLCEIKGVRKFENPNPKKIIFHSLHGTYLPAIYKESAMAKALVLRGHDVTMITCGGFIDNCSGLFHKNNPPSAKTCFNCMDFSEEFYGRVGLKHKIYMDYLKPLVEFENIKNHKEGKKYKGVDIEFHAKASLDRYYRGAPPDEETETIKAGKIESAIYATDLAEQIIKEEKPDTLVTSHSCYAEWGSFSDYFRNHNIPVHTWYTGYNPKSLIFNLDKIDNNFQEWLKLRKNKKLTNNEKLQLFQCRFEREKGINCDTSLYGYEKKTMSEVWDEIGLQNRNKIYGMFVNAPWDADLVETHIIFEDLYDWVSETIDLFKEEKDKELIIKVHPAENVYQSVKSIYDYIKENKELTENIKVLPPDTKISPYQIFDLLNVGIVYNTTAGLEMLLRGIPVISCGGCHYRGKGFTTDVKSRKSYKSALFKEHTIGNEELLNQYGYYYFIKSFIPFPYIYRKNFLDLGWSFMNYDKLLTDKYISHITKVIEGKKIWQDW